MSYRKYLILVAVIAIVSFAAWIIVLMRLDPCIKPGEFSVCSKTSNLSVFLFFASLFFTLTSTFTLMGFYLRIWLHHHEIYLDHFNISLRQGFLLSLCALLSLGFLLLNVLTWWSGLFLILTVVLIELYFTRSV